MLSPANAFILGAIERKPNNPYELLEIFNFYRLSTTLQSADSSVYASIRSMHRQGLIDYKLETSGKMPDKRVYTITEKGVSEFSHWIYQSLVSYHVDRSYFLVALIFISRYEKQEALNLLTLRTKTLAELLTQKKRDYSQMTVLHEIRPALTALLTGLQGCLHLEAELEITAETLKMVKEAQIWPQDFLKLYDSYQYGVTDTDREIHNEIDRFRALVRDRKPN
ncbi:MAG TPA: PadR family transcriptional regulator [Bellilinea sp.]|nr:PadR family transcriptional regulator [Bellilinea sp.]